eukprot:COSAG01_NODE_74454_length_212_cov_265.752212_1_plen_49_part_10
MTSSQVVARDPRAVHQRVPLCIACVFQLPSLPGFTQLEMSHHRYPDALF